MNESEIDLNHEWLDREIGKVRAHMLNALMAHGFPWAFGPHLVFSCFQQKVPSRFVRRSRYFIGKLAMRIVEWCGMACWEEN